MKQWYGKSDNKLCDMVNLIINSVIIIKMINQKQKTGNSLQAKPDMEALKWTQAKLSSEVEEWLMCKGALCISYCATSKFKIYSIQETLLLRKGGRNWNLNSNEKYWVYYQIYHITVSFFGKKLTKSW